MTDHVAHPEGEATGTHCLVCRKPLRRISPTMWAHERGVDMITTTESDQDGIAAHNSARAPAVGASRQLWPVYASPETRGIGELWRGFNETSGQGCIDNDGQEKQLIRREKAYGPQLSRAAVATFGNRCRTVLSTLRAASREWISNIKW